MATLSNTAKKTLIRIGNIFIPAYNDLPSYEASGAAKHIDEIVSYAPKADIQSLSLLLAFLSIVPNATLRWMVKQMRNSHFRSGNAYWTLFRQLDFGIRGIVLGTYYSGETLSEQHPKEPTNQIGFYLTKISD